MDCKKHSLKLAAKLPSDNGKTNGFLETFVKIRLEGNKKLGMPEDIHTNQPLGTLGMTLKGHTKTMNACRFKGC